MKNDTERNIYSVERIYLCFHKILDNILHSFNRVKNIEKVRNGEIGSSFYFWKGTFQENNSHFFNKNFILLTKTFIL